MIDEIQEGKEIKLRPIGKSIGWIITILLLFFFYEAIAREFIFFDEFSIFIILFVIAIKLDKLNKQINPNHKKKSLELLSKMKQKVLEKKEDKELALAYDEVMTDLILHPEE